MNNIKFGTDGWRAVIDKDFTKENVEKVINAISEYIYKQSGYKKEVIVGYDPRDKADEYAKYISNEMAHKGFQTIISDKIVATPVLAYSAKKLGAYAIMLTASHNPPEYLGIKFIPPYGGPAEDNMVKEIVKNLDKIFEKKREEIEPVKTDFEKDYIDRIKEIVDLKRIKQTGIKINYDGHHGACGKLFLKILDENSIEYEAQNIERDVNFGGFMPDPKEEYLPKLKKLCVKTGRIGLSNDGDGDRFGVFDEKGRYISPNNIICMLLKHLVKEKKYEGKLAKTVGASSMLDLYAKKCGIEVVETAVGFKWLGEAMRKDDIIIAGEESGGLSIKGHIPEKDGILANLLIMEMMAYSQKKLYELNENFLRELGRNFVNKRVDIKLKTSEEKEEIFAKVKELKEINGKKIIKINEIDGLKIYMEDDSTVLIRPSGTEPLLRIYLETDENEKIEKMKKSIRFND